MGTLSIILTIVVLIILLFFSAFFSAAETAYSSVRFDKIETDIKNGNKSAILIKKHYKKFGWTLATILISNNIVNIAASSLTTYFFSELLGSSPTVAIISVFVVTPLVVIFGEIIPKIFAKKHAYGYIKKVIYVIHFFNILFSPITYPLSKIAIQSKITNSETDIKNLIKIARSEGVLERDEASLAEKALDMDEKLVKHAMISKEKIIFIEKNSSVKNAKIIFEKTGHSRLIVKDNNKYIGILLLKDIAFNNDVKKIDAKIKPIVGVSKISKLPIALEKLRVARQHIALVFDKSNSNNVVGIITLEDIIEQLVGKIYDEHDKKTKINQVANKKWIIEGSTTMKSVSNTLSFEFKNSTDLTLKQWVQSRINRKIKKHLKYEYKDEIIFKVIVNKQKKETMFEIIKKR